MPGRRLVAGGMERFWELRSGGMSYPRAAALAGIAEKTGHRALVTAGGIRPRPVRAGSGRYLSLAEREEIAVGVAAGRSIRQIAKTLGRAPSTVSRELARDRKAIRGRHEATAYRATRGHVRAWRDARRPKRAKLVENTELRGWVQDRLALRWSPEQIAATLKVEFADRPEMRVSHETIYQSLYVQSRGALRRELTRSLRTGRAIRRPQRRADERRGRIANMVMISERPAEADDRAVPGHWEGDLIIGKDGASAIGTLVERTTRFCILLHLPHGASAEQVRDAMVAKIVELPVHLCRSLAWDQGREMAQHAQITVTTGLPVYFCDPHSPWQRGSNENTNGLLRQYFPKGTDLAIHSAQDLDAVAAELNGRPRKTLGWKTPAEAFQNLMIEAE